MKVNIQKIRKGIAFVLCALTLSFTVSSAYTIPVHASTITHASLYKVVDMALAKTGIVANNDIINSISETTSTDFLTAVNDFLTYVEETYGADYAEYLNALDEWYNQYNAPWEVYDVFHRMITEGWDIVEITADEIADILVGAKPSAGITTGVGYQIADEVVEYIKNQFDTMVTTGEFGYYYIDTLKPSEIPVSWFSTATDYSNIKAYCQSSEFNTIIAPYYGNYGNLTHAKVFDNSQEILFVRAYSGCTNTYLYNSNWVLYGCKTITSDKGISFSDYESFISYHSTVESTDTQISSSYLYPTKPCSKYSMAVISADGEKQIVYTSLDALKMYNGGQKPFYQVTNNDYSTTTDNSIDFTGDYYNNNSATYTYETIQNEIDNSTEINEETINNIVNTSTTTIINNYYTTPDSGDDGGNDDSGDTESDTTDYGHELVKAEISGLGGALIGIALEHYDTIGDVVTTIRDGMETVTDPINDTTEIIKGTVDNINETTREVSADLQETADYMGGMLTFIPDDYMTLIKLSLVASIGLGLWKAIRS